MKYSEAPGTNAASLTAIKFTVDKFNHTTVSMLNNCMFKC